MRFFERAVRDGQDMIFYEAPCSFTKYTEKQLLRYCLGAALYMPATRAKIADEVIQRKHTALTTIILDLEDALGDDEVEQGLWQLRATINELQEALASGVLSFEGLPLLFVRVRHPQQLEQVIALLGEGQHLLTGYVLPKFTIQNGRAFLEQITLQNALGYTLYAMPILESTDIFLKEQRTEQLLAVRTLLIEFYDLILNVRIGATDFSGLLGLRRTIHHTVYDVQSVRDCLADIVNVFLRAEPHFVLSGPVWEYFDQGYELAAPALEGLLRELELDCLNGLIGKTVIHPTHLEAVQAVYTVSHEDYVDALKITEQVSGVQKSTYGNKMNEMKPHTIWAERMLLRAKAYGVLLPQHHYTELLKRQVIR